MSLCELGLAVGGIVLMSMLGLAIKGRRRKKNVWKKEK